MSPYFKIPLDLPHACTISLRLAHFLGPFIYDGKPEHRLIVETMRQLQELLLPYKASGENPGAEQAQKVRMEAAKLGRELVDEIVRLGLQGDSVGKAVRNLFECLELGEEGAEISLRAGEKPDSLQRPR